MILSRRLGLDRHTPQLHTESDSLMLTLTETIDSTGGDLTTGRPMRGQWIKNNKFVRIALLGWTLFGASCVMADGLLTPAVSVISAVKGIVLNCKYSSQESRFPLLLSTILWSRFRLQSLSFW